MIVATSSGSIQGVEDGGVVRFLGVPYAAAPVGDLRFRRPIAHPGWSDVRDASQHGATVAQGPYQGAMGELLPTVVVPGDESLNLAIWAPTPAATPATTPPLAGGAPVMVWIHGGSLAHGSNALNAYNGTTFARDGVMFVAINYRIGVEGFSVLDGADANVGLHDALAAVRWVHREIAAFGGDPTRITLVGQSAGGNVIAALLASGAVDALVAGAIIQSGPPSAQPAKRAGRITNAIAKHLGIPATRDAFLAKTPDELVAAQEAVTAGTTPVTGGLGYAIAIDGDLVPATSIDRLAGGAASRIPLLIGWTSEEARLWLNPSGLNRRLGRRHLVAARILFKIRRSTYAAYRRALPTASNGDLFGVLAQELLLRVPALTIAQARAGAEAGAGTWVYEFAWPSPVMGLGAAHAVELPFVFDHLHVADARALTGDAAPQELATAMHGDWVRFVRDGAPGWSAWGTDETVRVYRADGGHDEPLPRADLWRAWG